MNEGKQLNCYQLQDFLHSVKIRTGIAQSVKNPFVKTPKDDQKEVENHFIEITYGILV